MNPLSVVRSDALLDPELQKCPAVYMTLAAISTFTTRSKDGYCYFKQETIAKHLGKSRQAISQHLTKLSKLGYVEIISQNYRGFKSNNAYRIKYDGALNHDASSPCIDESSPCTTTQAHLAAKCSSINAIKEKKERFFEDVKKEKEKFQFLGLGRISEEEIIYRADECWDFWEGYNKFPEGNYVSAFKGWLRKGKKRSEKASKGEREEISVTELPEWQQMALEEKIFDAGVFKSWIKPLEWNGNGTVSAPTRFIAETVEKTYMPQLREALHADIQIRVKPQEATK